MKLRRRVKHAAMAAAAAAALGVLFLGPGPAYSGSGPPTPEEEEEARRAKAPRRVLPSGPNDVIVMGVWRNDRFHIIKLRTQTTEIDMPEGKAGQQSTISSREEVEAQLPPVDPRFTGLGPTPEQIAEMEVKANAEQAKYRPRPPGAPPLPGQPGGP